MTTGGKYAFIFFCAAHRMNQAINDNEKKVFAFVPSYNHHAFIEKCLRSIFNQTFQPVKLLVIDDGSKDDSVQIIERVLKNAPFDCELIARENRGLCATLNEGFAESSGEYFAYLGSDDVWLGEFLAERVKLLNARLDAVLAYGHAFTIDADDNIVDCSAEWARFPDGDARPMLERGLAPFSPTVCYRRKTLENLRWNESAGLEDYELYLRLAAAGEFAFDAKVLAAWRQHATNTSHDWHFMLDEVLAAQRRYAERNQIGAKRLAEMHSATRLLYSETLARTGDKRTAFKLFFQSLSEIDSASAAAKDMMRLLVPMPVLRSFRRKRQREATRKYGKIKI